MEVTFWEQKFKVNLWIGCIGAFLVAIVSSMFGFGGGPFMTPLMAVGLGLPMYIVVGSSLLAIAFNTVIGSVQHWRYGNLDVLLFAVMFVAAILGGYIGPQIAKRLNPLVVKRVAAAGLIILALKLLNVY